MSTIPTTKKLTIQQPQAIHERIQTAASLRGMSVTSYVNSTMERDATETIESVRRRELTRADQRALVEMLLSDDEPNDALKRAAAAFNRK